jgi:hypothetical protein
MNNSIYAQTQALILLHNFDYDIAFLSVWYYHNQQRPTISKNQLMARLAQIKNIPIISDHLAQEMLKSYSAKKKGEK